MIKGSPQVRAADGKVITHVFQIRVFQLYWVLTFENRVILNDFFLQATITTPPIVTAIATQVVDKCMMLVV